MAKQLRTTLKGYFQSGNIPVEQHYVDIIDSTLNISEVNSGNIDLIGNIIATGNISSSGITGRHTFGGTSLYSVGDISGSGNISCSAGITSSGLHCFGNITASGNIKCGNFNVGGAVIADNATYTTLAATNLSLGGTTLNTTFAELNYLDGLTSGEATQIKNIGSNAISNTEWSYVAGGQAHGTSATPTFAAINIAKADKGGIGTYGDTIIVPSGGKAFTFTLVDIPTIQGINASLHQISKTAPTLIQNASVEGTDTIIINCINAQLSVTAFGQLTAASIGKPGFYMNISNDSHLDFTSGEARFTVVIL